MPPIIEIHGLGKKYRIGALRIHSVASTLPAVMGWGASSEEGTGA